jgi:hypothetical protein
MIKLLKWAAIIGAAFYCAVTQPMALGEAPRTAPISVIFSFAFFAWAFWMLSRAFIGFSRWDSPGSGSIPGDSSSRNPAIDQFTREALNVRRPAKK